MGVVVLVVVLAVMAGFEREIKSRLLGFSPHIELELMDGGEKQLIYDWPEIKAQVDGVEGVEEAAEGEELVQPVLVDGLRARVVGVDLLVGVARDERRHEREELVCARGVVDRRRLL